MNLRDLFIDTTVLAYAIGGPHSQREPCAALVQSAVDDQLTLHASVEAIAELVFHRLRRGSRADAIEAARIARAMLVVHDFDGAVLDDALDLMHRSALRSRDAVHAATAKRAGFTSIVTTDRDFDGIPGLSAITPAEALRTY